MRISTEKTDPCYIDDAYNYLPYLNGEPVENCVTADEEQGFVKFIIYGPEPFVIDRLTSTFFCTYKFGKVEIKRILRNEIL